MTDMFYHWYESHSQPKFFELIISDYFHCQYCRIRLVALRVDTKIQIKNIEKVRISQHIFSDDGHSPFLFVLIQSYKKWDEKLFMLMN